jgi:lipopolysaccharide export system permease protein
MLSRLDRYIFRAAALPFLLILACTTAVAWLTQVLQRMDIIVDDGGTLSAFLKITMLLIPTLAGVVMPIALLAACLYTLNVLLVDSEIPVMRAAGASKFRIARPLLLLSLVTAGAMLYVNLDLQPRTYRAMKDTIWDVRSDIASSLVRDQVFTEVTPGVTVYAEDVRPGDQFVGLHIFDARNPERETTYTAENGLFAITPTGPRLFLLRGTAQYRDPKTGSLEIARFTETAIELAELGDSAEPERIYETTERYIGELLRPDLSESYDRMYTGRLIAEGHARLATPLYCIAFGLTAAAIMLTATSVRRGYGRRLLLASAIAAAVRIGGFLMQSLAADLPAFNAGQYLLPLAMAGAAIIVLVNPRTFSMTKPVRRGQALSAEGAGS